MTKYVNKDENGKIIAWADGFCEGIAETPVSDEELAAFLQLLAPIPAISRRQFFQQAAVTGFITEAEALAAVTTGALPSSITTFISALPADQQFGAKMLFSVNEFQRSSPLANAFGTAIGMTSAQIDEFFTAASQL